MTPQVVRTPPRMVHVACPICGRRPSKLLYPDTLNSELPRFGYDFSPEHTKTYRVVFCELCRHAFSSPRPDTLWSHYEDVEDREYLARQGERLATRAVTLALPGEMFAVFKKPQAPEV